MPWESAISSLSNSHCSRVSTKSSPFQHWIHPLSPELGPSSTLTCIQVHCSRVRISHTCTKHPPGTRSNDPRFAAGCSKFSTRGCSPKVRYFLPTSHRMRFASLANEWRGCSATSGPIRFTVSRVAMPIPKCIQPILLRAVLTFPIGAASRSLHSRKSSTSSSASTCAISLHLGDAAECKAAGVRTRYLPGTSREPSKRLKDTGSGCATQPAPKRS
mmetsp:Transcript_47165/g.112025  ORF Transcript_47165/g.112025 Transcript_47165/m.112025 type:complete len:216 (-) Transcript_47165:170-817(-)